jgi:hypothetical protein
MPGDPPVVTTMQKLIVALDTEIARLQEARALLAGDTWTRGTKRTPKHHPMSRAARARISAAQKKRWAAIKKEART